MIDARIALIRLGIALLFGTIIGIEREWRHKSAGIKTNTLVAVGAATFAMLSNTFGPNNHNPAQLAAAVVTGIGFIGAGVIIHRRATVQGVTTAATLWANASMGVAIGLGDLEVAGAVFVAIVFIQFTMRRIGVWIDLVRGPASSRIELRVECPEASITAVNDVWSRYCADVKMTTMRRILTRAADVWVWSATFIAPGREPIDLSRLEEQLVAIHGVRRVDARFKGYEEEPDAVM
jgi:uncharacterized membrane protein YhiD involved in acid resistance